MLACIIMFSRLAGKYEKVNGVVDYAENTCGKGFAYYIGRFVATIYLPCITSVLAWVTARYFSVLFDRSITGGECMCLAGFILIACFVRNALAPKLAGKIQVATMIIKLESDDNQSQGDYYNLQGVKVANPTKGIYIQNGKKVVIK